MSAGTAVGFGTMRPFRAAVGHIGRVGLDDDPFDWWATKDGKVRVSRRGRLVTVVRGAAASLLIGKLARAGEREAQQLLARATGNDKRGNERNG
jgi:hypothetical protein